VHTPVPENRDVSLFSPFSSFFFLPFEFDDPT
jgi:hypothetical protein